MAATLQKLKDQGWHLSEDGLKKLVREDDEQVMDVKELVKRALDMDLRDISKGGGLASENMKSSKLDMPAVGVVVQVSKVRNVSAPKANEESKTSPRMLQLDLTDGQNVCVALEMENTQCLSVNIAPGTKILLKGNLKMSHGMLLLGPSNVSVLGGQVAALFEKWEQQRILAKYAKGAQPNLGPNGPPPWITFGQKGIPQAAQNVSRDNKFKSLSIDVPTETKENSEFTAMRNEAIAQANKMKKKKVFGGGKRNLIDHNVKKIIDKGFTEEEAQSALRHARNNLERAMGTLKRDRAIQAGLPVVERQPPEVSSGRFGKGRDRGGRGGRDEEPEGAAKPSGKVSLFDFLTDKIPLSDSIPITTSSSSNTNNNHNLNSNSGNNGGSSASFRNSNSAPVKTVGTSNTNSISNAAPKRSDDYTSNNHSSNSRRGDDHRNNHRRGGNDDGPKGYSTKNEDNYSRKMSSSSGPGRSSHLDEPVKSRAPKIENNGSHSNRSAKVVSNGAPLSTDRGSSGSSISVSSKNPFSLENREKFQNNVSASFANRNKRNETETSKKDSKPTTTTTNRQPSSNGNVKAKEPQKTSMEPVRNPSHNSRKGGQHEVLDTTNKSQQSKPSKVGPTSNELTSKENRRYENPFSKPLDRRGNKLDPKPRTTPPPPGNSSQDLKVAQLIKSTSELKVTEAPRPKPSKSTPSSASIQSTLTNNRSHTSLSRAAKLQQPQPTPKPLDPVFPNGFEFNPNKIMGFTNKETNEVAQSMLKAVGSSGSNDMLSQLLGSSSSSSAISNKIVSSLSPLPQAFIPSASATQPTSNNLSHLAIPPHNQVYSVRPVTSPQHQPHPPQQQQQQHHHFQQSQQQLHQHQPQFISPPQAPHQMLGLQHFNFALKLHDICFAKYWEDGRYYHAEITGMSSKTCVVEFTEYGNFEEVLITDCLPITDENIQMINQYNAGLSIQPSGHYQPQQQQQQPSSINNHHPVVPVPMHIPVQQQYQPLPMQQQQQQQPLLQTPQQHSAQPPQQQQQYQTINNQYNNQYTQQQQQQLQRMRGERQMYVPPAQRSTK